MVKLWLNTPKKHDPKKLTHISFFKTEHLSMEHPETRYKVSQEIINSDNSLVQRLTKDEFVEISSYMKKLALKSSWLK